MAASKPGSSEDDREIHHTPIGAPRAQTMRTRTLVLVHYYCYFFRSGGRRWPRFSVGFLTCTFGLAFGVDFGFALVFGRATGGPVDRACFRERGADPSVGAASAAGRFAPCPDTTLASCGRDVRGTSSLAEEDRAWCRARNPGKSRRAAALVVRYDPCKKV